MYRVTGCPCAEQAELGMALGEVYRKASVPEATFYNWLEKFGGLGPSER